MEHKDGCHILGIDRSASQEEIERAYRKLARVFRPDDAPGDHTPQ